MYCVNIKYFIYDGNLNIFLYKEVKVREQHRTENVMNVYSIPNWGNWEKLYLNLYGFPAPEDKL